MLAEIFGRVYHPWIFKMFISKNGFFQIWWLLSETKFPSRKICVKIYFWLKKIAYRWSLFMGQLGSTKSEFQQKSVKSPMAWHRWISDHILVPQGRGVFFVANPRRLWRRFVPWPCQSSHSWLVAVLVISEDLNLTLPISRVFLVACPKKNIANTWKPQTTSFKMDGNGETPHF